MQLIEVQRQNIKLQAQVKELQKQLDKQNLISADQSLAIQTDASKDDVMQNVNVLIKGTERQSEKAAEQLQKLEKKQVNLKQAIETLNTQIEEIEKKEEKLMKESLQKNAGGDHARYEQTKHEIQTANYALKTNINKKLTTRQTQAYDIEMKLN